MSGYKFHGTNTGLPGRTALVEEDTLLLQEVDLIAREDPHRLVNVSIYCEVGVASQANGAKVRRLFHEILFEYILVAKVNSMLVRTAEKSAVSLEADTVVFPCADIANGETQRPRL